MSAEDLAWERLVSHEADHAAVQVLVRALVEAGPMTAPDAATFLELSTPTTRGLFRELVAAGLCVVEGDRVDLVGRRELAAPQVDAP